MVALLIGCGAGRDSASFASKAAQGGLAEVELGRLAAQRGTDPSVKEFGQQMVLDHGRANAELKAIASRKNLQVPADLSSDQKSLMDKLSKLSGPEFDKEYMSAMVKDHKEDIKEFETQGQKGSDPDIKGFASKTLPTLRSHLQMAEEVAKKVGATS
jgi:putative membrane protein